MEAGRCLLEVYMRTLNIPHHSLLFRFFILSLPISRKWILCTVRRHQFQLCEYSKLFLLYRKCFCFYEIKKFHLLFGHVRWSIVYYFATWFDSKLLTQKCRMRYNAVFCITSLATLFSEITKLCMNKVLALKVSKNVTIALNKNAYPPPSKWSKRLFKEKRGK